MKQQWFCEGCGVSGTVTIPLGADVYAGVNSISRSHHAKSVICHPLNGIRKVRVRNPQLCTPKQWRELIHESNQKRARHD